MSTTSHPHASSGTSVQIKALKPFDAGEIKILLLENVNQAAVEMLRKEGYQVETYKKSLTEKDLIAKIGDVHAIGIRSKTKITKNVLAAAKKLLVIGCFCIGTNQVDLESAARQGVVVFNSPFSNSRSVAELVIAEIIALSRKLGDRNNEMHHGHWNKVSTDCYEIRGKSLGIIGYGHIGSQLSVLAEAMGLTVFFCDIVQNMPIGTAKQVSLDELLERVDFVSVHVPETDETKNMIGEREIKQMKPGSYLINASRGTVVQIPALIEGLQSKHLRGAAIDVYPREPAANGEKAFNQELNDWTPELLKCENLIMTPHIGGSTEEAQRMIGVEVATFLTKYINNGCSISAFNFPEVDLRAIQATENSCRLLFTHHNVPGVLKEINEILSNHNVDKQFSDSRGEIAYLMADISDVTDNEIRKIYEAVSSTKANILTRIVY